MPTLFIFRIREMQHYTHTDTTSIYIKCQHHHETKKLQQFDFQALPSHCNSYETQTDVFPLETDSTGRRRRRKKGEEVADRMLRTWFGCARWPEWAALCSGSVGVTGTKPESNFMKFYVKLYQKTFKNRF